MEEPELQTRMQLHIFERSSRVMAICMKIEINPVRELLTVIGQEGYMTLPPIINGDNFGASLGSYTLILEYQLPYFFDWMLPSNSSRLPGK